MHHVSRLGGALCQRQLAHSGAVALRLCDGSWISGGRRHISGAYGFHEVQSANPGVFCTRSLAACATEAHIQIATCLQLRVVGHESNTMVYNLH
jgi:hypothetical protein